MFTNLNVAVGVGAQAKQNNNISLSASDKPKSEPIQSAGGGMTPIGMDSGRSSAAKTSTPMKIAAESEINSQSVPLRRPVNTRVDMRNRRQGAMSDDRASEFSESGSYTVVHPVTTTFFVNRLDMAHWDTNELYKSTLRGGNEVAPSLVNQIAGDFPGACFRRAETRGKYLSGDGVLFIWCAKQGEEPLVAAFIQAVAVLVLPYSNETNRPGQYTITKHTTGRPESGPVIAKATSNRLNVGRKLYLFGIKSLPMSMDTLRKTVEESPHRGTIVWYEKLRRVPPVLEISFLNTVVDEACGFAMDFLTMTLGAERWSDILEAETKPSPVASSSSRVLRSFDQTSKNIWQLKRVPTQDLTKSDSDLEDEGEIDLPNSRSQQSGSTMHVENDDGTIIDSFDVLSATKPSTKKTYGSRSLSSDSRPPR